MQLLRWNNLNPIPRHDTSVFYGERGWLARTVPAPPAEGKNVLDIPLYPQTVVRQIDSGIAFSPEGQHIAYVRQNDPEVGKYRIPTASLEGNSETVLQIGAVSEAPNALAWSPRGDEISTPCTWLSRGSARLTSSMFVRANRIASLR